MISSTSFSNKAGVLLLATFLFLSGCSSTKETVSREPRLPAERPPVEKFLVAVFPLENLSASAAPMKEIRQSLMNSLKAQAVQVLDEDTLGKFMDLRRLRYTGGIDRATAQALKKETGADGVLIASLEYYSETYPPKISMTSRLISTEETPVILWARGVGLAGDDSPGILGLGLIEDPKALLQKATDTLMRSLAQALYTKTGFQTVEAGLKKKFRPKISYRSDLLETGGKYIVAVLPFLSRAERRNAGEIMVLHFIENLQKFEQFEVVELGVTRQELLSLRMILTEGVSIANAEAIFATLDCDLIVAGKVINYQDYRGEIGVPKVDFSVQLIDKKNRKIVWGSVSYNQGDDGVFFFDRGRVNTAHAMASQMTQWIVEMILEGKSRKPSRISTN